MRRMSIVLAAAMLLIGVAAEPAGATKPDTAGTDEITICHATNSATNPYVVITIDVAAWKTTDGRGHSPQQHVNRKIGARDEVLVAGSDCGGVLLATSGDDGDLSL